MLGLGVLCVASAGLAESAAQRAVLIVTAGLIVWYAFTRDAQAENRLFPSRPLSLTPARTAVEMAPPWKSQNDFHRRLEISHRTRDSHR